MKTSTEVMEPKRANRVRMIKYIASKESTSRPEIAAGLKISMPTTMQHVKELLELGVIVEEGTQESTGGRKAKALSLVKDITYSCGVDITRHHISLALVNARKELVAYQRIQENFQNTPAFFDKLEQHIRRFWTNAKVEQENISGVGFSLPGFVDKRMKVLKRSDVLGCHNLSFQTLGESLEIPFSLENDANSAAYAEFHDLHTEAVYLSLSGTVGGAIYYGEEMYEGHQCKSAEFGHMMIEKEGRTCYCGKKGCVDAYCNAELLQNAGDGSLETFFERLHDGNVDCAEIWEEYLEYLAIAVANLQMVFDCDIYLGGYVGGYLSEYLPALGKKVRKYNLLDVDSSYLKTGRRKLESSAYGVALSFIDQYFETLG